MKIKICLLLVLIFISFGCSGNNYQFIEEVVTFDNLLENSIKYDIREECELGHIPGFLCMNELSNDTIINNLKKIYKNKKEVIIVIGDEDDVIYILSNLSKKGYKSLYSFKGGYEEYARLKGDDFVPEEGCGC